jgi:agmatine deiminase
MAGNSTTTFMPAEHLPHQRTLTAFPNLAGCYDDPASTKAARTEVASIANAVSEFEPVWLYATSTEAAEARSMVSKNVTVKEADVDNLWIRDLGPVFVRSKGASSTDGAVDFNFNYWGGKSRVTVDQHFARRILASDFGKHTRHQAGIVSEGGALEVDGEGTLLVCDSSIINDNRNPGRSKEEIESELKRLLGVSKVIWLKGVKDLESTDWHVDAFARFVAPGHVILSKPPPNAHPAILEIFDAAVETFKTTTDAQGRSIAVTICQEPDQEKLAGGSGVEGPEGMVTSYVNYLLVNGGVVMAKFGEPETDAKAFEQIRSLFPDRRVVQVYINELPSLGGGIHCATQHIPV